MKNSYIYGAIGIVIIILAFVFWGKKEEKVELNTESTATTTETVSTGGNTSVQKPASSKPTTGTVKPTPGATAATPATSTPVNTTLNPAALNGVVVRLVSYNGVNLPADSRYTLSFEGGKVSARFCNSMGGEYIIDNFVIKSSNLTSTMMYCATPSNVMEIESSFSNMLNFGATISRRDGDLILSNGKTVMVFNGFRN